MKIQIVKKKDNEIIAVVDGTIPSFMNALRRAAMFLVPALAIEDIYFFKKFFSIV